MEPLQPLFTLNEHGEVTIELPNFPTHTDLQPADLERIADALWQIAADAPGIKAHLRKDRLKRTRRFYPLSPRPHEAA